MNFSSSTISCLANSSGQRRQEHPVSWRQLAVGRNAPAPFWLTPPGCFPIPCRHEEARRKLLWLILPMGLFLFILASVAIAIAAIVLMGRSRPSRRSGRRSVSGDESSWLGFGDSGSSDSTHHSQSSDAASHHLPSHHDSSHHGDGDAGGSNHGGFDGGGGHH